MTSLEWVMVSVAFFFMMISIFDLVRYVVVLQSVSAVMTEAGRACLVNPTSPICYNDVPSWSVASTVAPALDPSLFTITVNLSPLSPPVAGVSLTPGTNCIQVTVSYPYQATVPWMSSLNATISETATYFN